MRKITKKVHFSLMTGSWHTYMVRRTVSVKILKKPNANAGFQPPSPVTLYEYRITRTGITSFRQSAGEDRKYRFLSPPFGSLHDNRG
jgi:hypothetical protein